MCNECDCDNYEMCSIVGNIPIGFCCPNCRYYSGESACERSKIKIEWRKKEIAAKTELLREVLSGKKQLSKKELEKFP
jgi:hypothetical protein